MAGLIDGVVGGAAAGVGGGFDFAVVGVAGATIVDAALLFIL